MKKPDLFFSLIESAGKPITTAELAVMIDRPFLTWHDRAVLKQLAKDGRIRENCEIEGVAKVYYTYEIAS